MWPLLECQVQFPAHPVAVLSHALTSYQAPKTHDYHWRALSVVEYMCPSVFVYTQEKDIWEVSTFWQLQTESSWTPYSGLCVSLHFHLYTYLGVSLANYVTAGP